MLNNGKLEDAMPQISSPAEAPKYKAFNRMYLNFSDDLYSSLGIFLFQLTLNSLATQCKIL